MQNTHTLVIKARKTGKVLKRFEYPSKKIIGKFFWEKIKQEEVTKYLKAHDMVAEDVILSEKITA